MRLQSEGRIAHPRIDISDAIIQGPLRKQGLQDEYAAALGRALRCSTKIRNQYAHSHWAYSSGGLFFTDMDKTAKTSSSELMLVFYHVDIALLTLQETYMNYAMQWLLYLSYEYRKRVGELASHDWQAPKINTQSRLSYNPREESPLLES